MNIFKIIIVILFLSAFLYSQPVTTDPEFITENDSIIIYFHATEGDAGLQGFTGDVYAHSGVITNLSIDSHDWKYVMAPWATNYNDIKLIRDSLDHYHLVIGKPRVYYSNNHQNLGSIPLGEQIQKLAFVFRNADGSRSGRDVGGADIFIDVYEPGLNVVVNNPDVSVDFGDPQRSPAFVKQDSSVLIKIKSVALGTETASLTLFINDSQVAQSNVDSLDYLFNYSDYSQGPNNVVAVGTDTSGSSDSTIFMMFVNPPIVDVPPPAGVEPGITINNPTSVTFLLFAPHKDFVYLIGDFNDWKVETNYFLNRWETSPDNVVWWITVNNISVGIEQGYQFFVDGKESMRVGDPFGHKVLDPWNDVYIADSEYPNLKSYPQGKTLGIVTTFQTGLPSYPWQITDFQKPPKEELVVYELLLRDFLETHDFKTLRDTIQYLKVLGVNAIELMPVMEFEGNNSWGYNPMYHLALDKYYGPANDFKSFIDSAHANGIAVIMDMVLNHAFGLSPLVKLYWDAENNRPAANSPYFNQIPKHPFNVGYDFNHESEATKYFVDRVNKYWLEEFKIDGFRFDLSKGFTQTNSGSNVNLWGQYDQSRIDILTRMADTIWTSFPDTYIILEHFAVNSEETVLSNYGMMLWGNMNYEYNEATMGYNSNLSGATHISRGWNDLHLVSYMESHDEERLMFKNLQYGNSKGNYDIKNFPIAIQRIKLAAAFFFTIPGPKMIWQFEELGYDYSINYPDMTDAGRLKPKPIRWDYYNDGNRRNLYKVFQALLNLRQYDAFKTKTYSYNLSTTGKRLTLIDPSMNVNIIGNFGVDSLSINPLFPYGALWYDYFSGDTINVTNVNEPILLEPGEFHIYTTVKLPTPEGDIISDVEYIDNEVVEEYFLKQNYPNPFNPTTTIKYQIPESGFVSIKIFDVLGNEIASLINEEKPVGSYQIEFKADGLSSGVYFYQLQAGDFFETKKMLLLK